MKHLKKSKIRKQINQFFLIYNLKNRIKSTIQKFFFKPTIRFIWFTDSADLVIWTINSEYIQTGKNSKYSEKHTKPSCLIKLTS